MKIIETTDFGAAIRGAESDVLLVRPGVTLPPLAAERLSWTAYRTPGVASVSPVIDSLGEAASFVPIADRGPRDWSEMVRRVDACCRAAGGSAPVTDEPSAACVFARHQAIREVLAVSPGGGWAEFVATAAALKYSHRIADHVYALAPDGPSNFARLVPAHGENVRKLLLDGTAVPAVERGSKPVQLHILHGWGGGAEQWVRDYCAHDGWATNYVLTTECDPAGNAVRLCLYARLGDPAAISSWPLAPGIEGTRIEHAGYRAALSEIITRLGIGRIVISSLVGHSLDALRTGLPTLLVAHDYYPFCPVFGITFGGTTCRACGDDRLSQCRRENRLHAVFPGVPGGEWSAIRRRFLEDARGVTIVAPSESVRRNYASLAPALAERIQIIPHGTPALDLPLVAPFTAGGARLRVLVPGRLSEAKGADLLAGAMPGLLEFADVTLAGCGAGGARWKGTPGVTVIEAYQKGELSDLLRAAKPDLALLLSIVPETFSYTLQEMFAAGVAPVAVRVGAFEDRIQDGDNGFLCDGNAAAVVSRLRGLDAARDAVKRVHEKLRLTPVRSAPDMIRDYDALRGERWSGEAYFAPGPPAHWNPPGEQRVQLFWRSPDQLFREELSAAAIVPEGDVHHTVRFAIPPVFPRLAELRFDPGARRGFVLLSRMSLLDTSGQEVWSWHGGKGFHEPALRAEIDDLGDTDDGKRLLYMTGGDPRFGLPVGADALAKLSAGGVFEADLVYPDPNRFIDELVKRVEQEKREALASVEARLHQQEQTHREAIDQERNRLFYVLEAREALLKQLMGLYEYERHHGRTAMQELEAIKGSLSWRITAPLRGAMRPFAGK